MKTNFYRDKDTGITGELILNDLNTTIRKEITFNPLKMNNWYPLNINYGLFYRVSDGKILLKLESKANALSLSYGLNSTADKKVYNILKSKVMDSPEIKEDNNEAVKLAKFYNLAEWTWQENYSIDYIENSIVTVCNYMSLLTHEREEEYFTNLSYDNKYDFTRMSKERKEQAVLNVLSEDNQRRYFELGKVYTMLNIMKKIATSV